ncbi:MAG TPA: GIY-YIG nuclease family protein, partial [Gemmatimonadaceae bacterium]|nr:GIY-YIG nuclease family protein [Gemmatimonadaceae bacterium]
TGVVFLNVSMDLRVLAFTIMLTVGSALLFGLLPALRASRPTPMDALKSPGAASTSSRRLGGPVGLLIVVQVALSLVLVVAAGLFTRTLTALDTRNLGFDPQKRYIGVTSDVEARVSAHNARQNRSTAPWKPWTIDVIIEFRTERLASRFEKYLKSGAGHAFATSHFVDQS